MSDFAQPSAANKHGGITRLAADLVSQTANLQWRRFSSLRSRLRFGYKATGLGLQLESFSTSSQKNAARIYRGEFEFAGICIKRRRTGIFLQKARNPNWRSELLSFDWLADMRAAGRELSRVQSRALIREWLDIGGDDIIARQFNVNFDTAILARRLIAFACHARFLLEGADDPFARRFYSSVSRQTKLAYSRSYSEPDRLKRLHIHIALAYVSLAFTGYEGLRNKVFSRLSSALDKQIFGDGGHVSRNPQVLRDLLVRLVPLRAGLETARMEVPAVFNNALERMLPALRFFTCPDGGLGVFNGVNDTRPGLTRRIFAADKVNGRPLTNAPHSGYARLQQAKASLLIDVGPSNASRPGAPAPTGLLAFEFCDGAARLVTNCGSMQFASEPWQSAARSHLAYSSLDIAGTSPGTSIDTPLVNKIAGGPVAVCLPHVETDLASQREGVFFAANHDGYENRFGIRHTRQLYLSANGHDLRGKDMFSPAASPNQSINPAPFNIRFHLHPSVTATLSRDGASAVLVLANKTGWRFSARGAKLRLQESVYLPENGRVRKTMQLVLSGDISAVQKVQWAFKRIEKRKTTSRQQDREQSPALL